jgi:hypothetical protein
MPLTACRLSRWTRGATYHIEVVMFRGSMCMCLFPVFPFPILLADILNGRLVGQRSDGLGDVLLEGDGVGVAGTEGLALEDDDLAVALGLGAKAGVLLDAAKEVVARARKANVLDADVQALLEVTVLDLLVDDDANSGLAHVVDDAL